MTREELVEIMYQAGYRVREAAYPIADRILAALAKEREAEARDGWRVEFAKGQSTITLLVGVEHEGKTGQLIFRPAKGKE